MEACMEKREREREKSPLECISERLTVVVREKAFSSSHHFREKEKEKSSERIEHVRHASLKKKK